MRIVYATMAADIIHHGHIQFIKKAKELGDYLIIGLHPDDVIQKYKRTPITQFNNRKKILEAIKEVDLVVEDCMNFREPSMKQNLEHYGVDIIVHDDEWLPPTYQEIKKSGKYEIIQVPRTKGISSTDIIQKIQKNTLIRQLPKEQGLFVSAGDAITAKLVQEAGFDGIWVSGFETSARLGLVDNGTMTMTEMLMETKKIVDAVKIPIIVDVDNGYGSLNQFVRTIQEFEKIGVSAICVEDNKFPKENSLWGGTVELLSMKEHGMKIKAGKDAQRSTNFAIIARTEALIRGYGMKEAITRAEYYAKCGADYILIHTRDESGKEALEIPKYWKLDTPLIIIPTKFPQIKNKELFAAGFSAIIWANHTERVKIAAIKQALKLMKRHNCPLPIEKSLSATLDDMRNLTPIAETKEREEKYKIRSKK